jgi:mannose-6-phosphate isomerase-like protein (cupin superfamily)
MTPIPGKVVVRDQIEPVRWTVEQGRILLRANDTGGLFSLVEFTTAPGGGPPAHVHGSSDEAFYITSGHYSVRLGDEEIDATPGTVVFGPRGVAHGFRNTGGEPATMLCIATPGGVERMFEGLAEILNVVGRPDRSRIADLVAQHDITYL